MVLFTASQSIYKFNELSSFIESQVRFNFVSMGEDQPPRLLRKDRGVRHLVGHDFKLESFQWGFHDLGHLLNHSVRP